MITDAPRVTVSGIDYPIYSVDFEWGGADKASTLRIDFVNAEGEYNTPTLQTQTLSKIKIGDFWEFNGYPVTTTVSNSKEGDVLTVEYQDSSLILDHIFVGLHGIHGDSRKRTIVSDGNIQTTIPVPDVSGTFNNIILIGDYLDPCENVTDDYLDPCNPCSSQADLDNLSEGNANKKVRCLQDRSTRILDVVYNFNQLLAGLAAAGVKFKSRPVISNSYYGRHSGVAREVLKSWCNELGFTFYWDKDSVVFVDMKTGIDIQDTNFYQSCSLLSSSTTESIRNNTYLGNLYYFGAEGEVKDYDCSSDNIYRMSLIPITLKDIFWSNIDNGEIGGTRDGLNSYISKYYTNKDATDQRYVDKDSIEGLQLACILSKYSSDLRDLTLLYHFYGVNEISEELVGRAFPLLGIKKVISVKELSGAASSDDGSKRLFFNTVDTKLKEFVKENHGKIIKVEYNAGWHTKFKEFEKKLADDFIGRYWIRHFSRGARYQINAPDGSAQYYVAGSPSTLPFMELIPESVKSQSLFLQRMINQTNELNEEGVGGVGEEASADAGMLENSFILVDRQPNWEPAENSEAFRKFEEEYGKFGPFHIDPFRSEVKDKTEDALKVEEVFIVAYNRPDTYTVDISDDIEYHPIETANKNIRAQEAGFNTYFGLRSSITKKYTLRTKVKNSITGDESANGISIFFPVQAHDNFGVEYAGYTVILTGDTTKIGSHSLLEKVEVIVGDCPPKVSIGGTAIRDTVGIQINWRDLTSSIIDILSGDNGVCQYSVPAIKQIINEFKIKTTRQRKFRETTKSYTLSGYPTRELTITDGISGFSIRYTAASGFTTNLSFNNTPPISIDQRIIDKELENNLLRRFLKHKPVSSGKKILI